MIFGTAARIAKLYQFCKFYLHIMLTLSIKIVHVYSNSEVYRKLNGDFIKSLKFRIHILKYLNNQNLENFFKFFCCINMTQL